MAMCYNFGGAISQNTIKETQENEYAQTSMHTRTHEHKNICTFTDTHTTHMCYFDILGFE